MRKLEIEEAVEEQERKLELQRYLQAKMNVVPLDQQPLQQEAISRSEDGLLKGGLTKQQRKNLKRRRKRQA